MVEAHNAITYFNNITTIIGLQYLLLLLIVDLQNKDVDLNLLSRAAAQTPENNFHVLFQYHQIDGFYKSNIIALILYDDLSSVANL